MNSQKRKDSVIAISPSATLVGFEGYFVGANGIVSASPVGVVVQGYEANQPSSIAILAGGYCGSVFLKLAEPTPAFSHVGPLGTGKASLSALTKCAQTLEAGLADELVEAVIYKNA